MDSSLLSSVLGSLFLLCAIAIMGVIALLLAKVRADGRSATNGTSEERVSAVPPSQGFGHVWPLVLGVVVAALAVAGVLTAIHHLTPPGKPIVVKVSAYQFGWRFDYYEAVDSADSRLETVRDPRRDPSKTLHIRSLDVSSNDRLTLPSDADVLFLVTSIDVIHRFWVPEFQVRRDVIPGAVTDVWVHPQRAGRFIVRSDDVCGAGDSLMVAALDIVGGGDFHAWLAQKEPPKALAGGAGRP